MNGIVDEKAKLSEKTLPKGDRHIVELSEQCARRNAFEISVESIF